MAKAKKQPTLRWRSNCIRFWRESRDITLEAAAERLGRPPFNLDYTHNSLGRVENGKQMPTIELIEALAKLYETDVDSLLNRRPEPKAGTVPATAKGLLQIWDNAAPEDRSLIIDVARKVAGTKN